MADEVEVWVDHGHALEAHHDNNAHDTRQEGYTILDLLFCGHPAHIFQTQESVEICLFRFLLFLSSPFPTCPVLPST
jgi:hypothetical protein